MNTIFSIQSIETFDFDSFLSKLKENIPSGEDLYADTRKDRHSTVSLHHTLGLRGRSTTGVELSCSPTTANAFSDFISEEDPTDDEDLPDYLQISLHIPRHACREDIRVGLYVLKTLTSLYPHCEVVPDDNDDDVIPEDDYPYGEGNFDVNSISVEREFYERSLALYIDSLGHRIFPFKTFCNGPKELDIAGEGLNLDSSDPMKCVAPLWEILIGLAAIDSRSVYIPEAKAHSLKNFGESIWCPEFFNHAPTLIQPGHSFVLLVCGYRRKIVRTDVLRSHLAGKIIFPTLCHAYFIIPRMEFAEYRHLFDSCEGFTLSDRRVFLMRWNPLISDVKREYFNRLTVMPYLEAGLRWAVTDWAEIRKDDYALLACVGTGYDGLVAGGPIIGRPTKGRDWADSSRPRHYVNFNLDMAIDPESEYALPAAQLEALAPGVDWHGGHSGIILQQEEASTLLGFWRHQLLLNEYIIDSYWVQGVATAYYFPD